MDKKRIKQLEWYRNNARAMLKLLTIKNVVDDFDIETADYYQDCLEEINLVLYFAKFENDNRY